MDKLRYALSVLAGLAFIVAAGAVATAPEAAAQNITVTPNVNPPRIITPRLLPRVIKPNRALPNDQDAQPATDDQTPGANQANNPQPSAKKRRVASRRAPPQPNGRPVFFPDDLDSHPLGLFLAGPYDAETVLVQLEADANAGLAEEIALAHGMEVAGQLSLSLMPVQFVRYRLPAEQSVPEAIAALSFYPGVLAASPNYLYGLTGSAATNSIQYAPAKIRVDEAHRIAKGRDVLVAVIDSGIDAGHPELSASVAEKFEAIDFDPADEMRHGTAMAAVIAANSQLLGIAPSVRLLSARAFGVPKGASKASATTFAILKSMQWSYERGARIFNLSFAGPRDPALIKGLDALAARDVIMVAAAGNAGPDAPPAYPGAHSGVIAVTATDTADVLFTMANNGKYVALAAPGVDVMTATPGKRYELMSGTSVAAAHVTGVVALMMEKDPGLKPAIVRQTLADSAIDLGPEGPDSDYGAGLVNALAALEQTGKSRLVAAD
jgi:subtilisin family serine protease